MRELVNHAFDFFAYVLPGLFAIFSISILAVPIDSIGNAVALTEKITPELATVIVFIAYVVGFCIYPLGRMIYKTIGFKLFGNNIAEDSNKSNLSVPTKYALIRELSPTNFKYVESWNTYCAMSHNLMVASILYCLVALIKFWQGEHLIFWFSSFFIGLAISLILMHRAVNYFHWAAYDINATISGLNLREKSSDEN